MKFLLLLSVACLLAAVNATTEPVCGYETLDGNMKFLKYFRGINEGEKYIDYGSNTDGTCVQEATCQEDYTVSVIKCEQIKIKPDCSGKAEEPSSFPGCCVKC